MNAEVKDMDQQFAELDKELLEDAPPEQSLEDDNLDKIDALLRGENIDDEPIQTGGENAAIDGETKDNENAKTEDEETEAPDDADEDAEVLADKINYDDKIEVPMPNGMESMTIGEMKDICVDLDVRTARLDKRSNEQMVQHKYINDVMKIIGEVPAEMRQAISENNQRLLATEMQAMNEAIPEWQDKQIYIRDDKSMLSLANEYGYTEKDYRGVVDHRLIKLVRDYTLLRNKVEGARAIPTKKPNKKQTTRRRRVKAKTGNTDKLIAAAANSDNREFKDAAIAKLLE